MFENLKLKRLAKRLERCKVTPMSRPQLRALKLKAFDQIVTPLEYIDRVASTMPTILINGHPVDVRARMREIFYRYGLKGLNIYVDYMKLRLRVEVKKSPLN